jgi:hypothetical protein
MQHKCNHHLTCAICFQMLAARIAQRAAVERTLLQQVCSGKALLPVAALLRCVQTKRSRASHDSIITSKSVNFRWAAAAGTGAAVTAVDGAAAADSLSPVAAQVLGPSVTNATGTYPDYSILSPTIAGEHTTDWLLSWFQKPLYMMHDAGLSWMAAVAIGSLAVRGSTAPLYFSSVRGIPTCSMCASSPRCNIACFADSRRLSDANVCTTNSRLPTQDC